MVMVEKCFAPSDGCCTRLSQDGSVMLQVALSGHVQYSEYRPLSYVCTIRDYGSQRPEARPTEYPRVWKDSEELVRWNS